MKAETERKTKPAPWETDKREDSNATTADLQESRYERQSAARAASRGRLEIPAVKLKLAARYLIS